LKTKYGENLEEGSLGGTQIDQHVESGCLSDEHLVIVTYWKSFDQHEKSTQTLFSKRNSLPSWRFVKIPLK